MQKIYKSIALPSVEYARLQALMLTMVGSRTALASVLRRKLGAGEPVSAAAVPADMAVSGRQVHFMIDGQRSEARVLSWTPQKHGDATNLSLLSPRGLALLGLSAGESTSYRTESGRTEFLKVERVSRGDAHASDRGTNRIEMPQTPVTGTVGAIAGGWNA